ncbi:MAG: hypothetical protein NZL95_08280 [Chitinophagales bacterium]|nr:hypothetical protein [Chitinophagales bacterium]MDW8428534.1 hypothetical protein [Chitinophagales bacterium]
MKPLLSLLAVALIAASCSTSQKSARVASDDVYISKSTPSGTPAQTQQPGAKGDYPDNSSKPSNESENRSAQPDYSYSEHYTDEQGNTYITNNYYYGDNYDFYDSYTARLSRWYDPYCGFSYFSPFYTGWYWGFPVYYTPGFYVSIGWGWYRPWYDPWYFSWYYPPVWYNPWFYDPWYSPWGWYPYWAYGYPYYGSYWSGYWHGYYHGWNDALGWGSGRYYYGPRGSSSDNVPGSSGIGRQYRLGGDNTVTASAVTPINRTIQRPTPVRTRSVEHVVPAIQGKPIRDLSTPDRGVPYRGNDDIRLPDRKGPDMVPNKPQGDDKFPVSPSRPRPEGGKVPDGKSGPQKPGFDRPVPQGAEPQGRPRSNNALPPKGMGQLFEPWQLDKQLSTPSEKKRGGMDREESGTRVKQQEGFRFSSDRETSNTRHEGRVSEGNRSSSSSSAGRPSGNSSRPPR